jgi:ubiquinone/menaquinone biosynthesis C-methylase UbiE
MKDKISLDADPEEYKAFYEDFYEKSDVNVHDPVLRFVAHDVIMSKLSFDNTSEGMLLDVGSGSGVISRLIADSTKLKCFGFDISETAVKRAHKSHHGHNCHFVMGSGEHIPFKDSTFDYVSVNHILEHIPDDTAALHELYRVLKKKGETLFGITK